MRSWQSYLINTLLRLVFKRRDPGAVSLQKQRDDFERMMRRQFRALPGIAHRTERVDGLVCDLAEPTGGGSQRTLLYFHGGGYVLGSPVAYRDLTGRLAQAAQATVVSLDYRLAPEHPYPAALEDALRCYRALLRQGKAPASLVLAGDSAGGGLALATLVALRDAGDRLPAAAVCLSPWTDLAGSGASLTLNAGPDPMLTARALAGMARSYAPDKDLSDPLISPLYADLSNLPPLLLLVGSTEILRDDSERVAAKVAGSGGQARLEVWDGMPHVWPMFAAWLPEGRRAIALIGEFVRTRTGG